MRFEYELTGAGWSRARIQDDVAGAEITASYLSDALRDLLDAVAEIAAGADAARCAWDEEPGEFRFIFERNGHEMRMSILWFDELWGGQPDEAGTPVFETRQTIDVLARAVHGAAAQVLEDWGQEGYLEKWIEAPFPTDALARLTDALPRWER